MKYEFCLFVGAEQGQSYGRNEYGEKLIKINRVYHLTECFPIIIVNLNNLRFDSLRQVDIIARG